MRNFTFLSFVIALFLTPAMASASEDVVVVYDASGSMWGQIEGVSKIEIAREVMGDLVDNWSADVNLGLVAYGHRREADCGDIETVIAPGPLDRARFLSAVNEIRPNGRTPLSAAVAHAAELLAWRDNPATVVLISDGLETCQADPCALSAQLAAQGVGFTTHVIGFDLTQEEHAQLACIAENTGGVFVPAQDADELHDAIAQVQSVIDLKPVAAPEPAETPVAAPDVVLTAPEQVTIGATFPVSWSATINTSDYVGIVPMGADEGERGNHLVVRDASKGELTAPAEPGLYEVRYILYEGRSTIGRATIEVTDATVSLTAPEQVTIGTTFPVSWSKSINTSDYVGIVPMGADEGERGNHLVVRDASEGELTAPAEPGLYEVRYILYEGRSTIGRATIEVTEATVSLTAPEQVTTGATFPVSWSATINTSDYVGIVPMGADEGERGNHLVVRDASEGELTAPAEPGLYEVRYILYEGRSTIGRATIEVTDATVSLTAPEQVTTGATFPVTWSATINTSDYVGIVPMGADEGERGNHLVVRDASEGELTAPAEPGLYEVRYILYEGRRTMASTPIEVGEPEIVVTGPGTVRAGSEVTVSWSTTINTSDYVGIVPVGADEGERGIHLVVREASEGRLTAPSEPGLYEVRYILFEGRRTLARDSFEVVAADAPLDEGAGLSVPATAAPGSSITVTWTADSAGANHRIALARIDQPDFSWVGAYPANENKTLEITLPDEPGTYEVRFLDIGAQAVLGRSIIEAQ
ncbi:VWA domain-containing protein [Mariluticola halotolerans]|uniref:VWA domain-containing protein n=1 Tax=Mariluticola halotolerans TaxID=2909283 RepID=UPI0026E3C67E|nr:VWA domain-containing protein [Mariluticola halotolerans]UJQ93890.1 VWA domain-containing protein [Mariluticola halotolerans]